MSELQEIILSYIPTGVSLITFIVVGFTYLIKLKNYVAKNKLEDYAESNKELIERLNKMLQLQSEEIAELREMNKELMESVTRVKSN